LLFNLHDGLAYDPEPLGAGARHKTFILKMNPIEGA
jgi:hypothetical protein